MSEPRSGLLPIFRSRHQLTILGYLFVHAGRGFSVAEVSRATGVPQPTVSREVARLARAGILTARWVGRTKIVEADRDSPYFPELRALLTKAMGPVAALRERLRRVPDVEEAYLFGSWARRYAGEPGPPPADLDVLVIGGADPEAVDTACATVQRRLDLEVNNVVLTREEWRGGSSGFIRQLRKGPLVPILEGAA